MADCCIFCMVVLFIWKVPKQKYWFYYWALCARGCTVWALIGLALAVSQMLACWASGRSIIPFHCVFHLENGSIRSMIVRLASELSYLKFALGGWARIPSCVSMYVFGAQERRERYSQQVSTVSKLHDYFFRSVKLHDYFLRSVNCSRLHYKYTTIDI